MKKIWICAGLLVIAAIRCDQPSPGPLLSDTAEATPEKLDYQLDPSIRDSAAEEKFLAALKNAIANHDKAAIEKLYWLENVSPQAGEIIPSVIDQLSQVPVEGLEISIEPNDKAARHRLRFSVPYLGDVVVVSRTEFSRETMRIPVGIANGRYYLCAAAIQED